MSKPEPFSFFIGDPPYECACVKCGACGPAAYTTGTAEELAEKAGWKIFDFAGDEDGYLCAACAGNTANEVPDQTIDEAPL
jgi:hypothetical protein